MDLKFFRKKFFSKYYYRARYYDPGTGRFLSEDPIGLKGGMNKYLYSEASPVNNNDPRGLLSQASLTSCAVGFIAGEAYDIFDNVKTGIDLYDEYKNKFEELDKERKTCTSKRRDEIDFKEKPKLLKEYQDKSNIGVFGVFTPGTGAQVAAGACILMLSTF